MNFFKPKFWDKNQVSLFSILLFPISLWVNFFSFFKSLIGKKYTFSIPIVCVGNIYLGGTGKTPFCIELFSILKKLNRNPAFIRKKYKSFQDEVLLLEQTGETYVGNSRINALNKAIKDKVDVAILDDGFQDFSLKKDLSIVCFNESQWIGNGFVIPSGPLRERLSALSRANLVVVNGRKNVNIENKILENNKLIKIFYTKFKPENIDEFKNKKAICFAGIGNPDNFYNLLKENNVDIVKKINFPDHYTYSEEELDDLVKMAKEHNVILITTEKDYFRINNKYAKNIKYLKITTEIQNQEQFIEEIKKFI